ncbi:MAG: SCP2 sterol-binding domain-containing protein [Halorientalis sp.]
MSTTQQRDIDEYFPTTAWLDRYQTALDEDDELDDVGEGWGVGWNGDFIFEMRNLPLEETTVGDLPEELWSALEAGITQLPGDTMENVIENAPEEVRADIEARDGPLQERAVAELKGTSVADAPDRVWPGLRNIMPDVMNDLLDELENNISEDGHVYAWIGLEDGGCYEVATLDTLDERDAGFVLTGEWEQWSDLVTGDIGPVDGIMSGALELDGDMQKILQYTDAAMRMTDVASELDKRFLL